MKKSTFPKVFILIALILTTISLLREYQVLPSYINASKYQALPEKQQKDRKFVFIIPMYNHSNITSKMLQSIEEQTYKNYRVLCIDDGSTVPSKDAILNFLDDSDLATKFHYVEYPKHRGAVERLYEAIQQCDDDEIVIYFEGNGWLESGRVLEGLNELYKKNDVWLAYGKAKNARTNNVKHYRPLNSQNFFSSSMRRKHWEMLRFKSFYAGLFKKIKIEDLFFRGKFIDDRMDRAYMFPMMEMAADRVAYFPEVCLSFVQDDSFTLIERPSFLAERKCLARIMGMPPYSPLNDLFYIPPKNRDADLVVFSYDRPLQLHALLESIHRYMTGYHQIFVIYKTSEYSYDVGFEILKQSFPAVQFIRQANGANDFQSILIDVLKKASPYIAFSVDDIVVKDSANIEDAVSFLEKTEAYCFSLRLGEHINYCYMGDYPVKVPDHVHVSPEVLGWQINSARGDWTYPNSLDMTIYHRDSLLRDFSKITFSNPNELEIAWNKAMPKRKLRQIIGLSYHKSKALNLPLNQVFISDNRNSNLYQKEELLQKYLDGIRIDIGPLFQMENASVHIDYKPTFVHSRGKSKNLAQEDKAISSPSES